MEEIGARKSSARKTCCLVFRDRDRRDTGWSLRRKPFRGGVAQLGEHLPCKQGVMGSIPIISTNFKAEPQSGSGLKFVEADGCENTCGKDACVFREPQSGSGF